MTVKKLTRCAVLVAVALALSVAEALVPLTIIFPLPGLRLGLANLVTVYALVCMGTKDAALILICRCFLGALMGGNLSSLAFSLTGGLLAFAVEAILLHCKPLSLFGICIAGAAGHNTGQIFASIAVMKTPATIVYLPPLLLASLLTGAFTGWVAALLIQRLPVDRKT